jgi:hypothetical protein
MVQHSNLLAGHGGKNKLTFIPESVWTKEIRALFLNIVKWNAGYLLLLSLTVFTVKKGARKTLWSLTGILFLISSLASIGTLNGKNRLKGTHVINISNGEDAFLQSGLSIISARGGHVSTELQGGFLDPVTIYGKPAAKKITLTEKGAKKITANMEFLNYNNFLWERFEKPETVLEVNLKVYPDKVKGYISNLSKYELTDPFVMIRGRFFPLPPIAGGKQIPVEIIFGKDDSMLYPEGLQWIRSYIRSNKVSGDLQSLKVLGLWEKPILTLKEDSLSMQEEKTVLLFHM